MEGIQDILQVVLITYNREKALARTLERIFAPESPIRDCDITVLDNCSTDGTAAMLGRVSAGHPNMKVVRHPRNIGGNANIIRAFELAVRKYIWVMCDDDDLDWSRWTEVGGALLSGEHDLVFTVSHLSLRMKEPDIGYKAFLAAFVPGCIYRSELITGDVLQNMYAMIHTWYPQCVLSLYILCNLQGRHFLPAENLVIRRMDTPDGERMMTMDENDATLTRGISERFLHPDMRRMFWHVGFVVAAQIIVDPALRAKVVERARFNESWEDGFRPYCEHVIEYNREYKGGSLKNLMEFFLNLDRRQRRTFLWAAVRPRLPFQLNISGREIELVLLWRIKLRLWRFAKR
ncbi:MAG: glycosyltransferase family 2 protein [bacterium]|nr:glycosyltransferase family 2 protein [Candidatus Colisoma equi]